MTEVCVDVVEDTDVVLTVLIEVVADTIVDADCVEVTVFGSSGVTVATDVVVCKWVSVSIAVDGGLYVSVVVSDSVISVVCVVVLMVVSVSVLNVDTVEVLIGIVEAVAVTVMVDC
jgi:hypothetical protein